MARDKKVFCDSCRFYYEEDDIRDIIFDENNHNRCDAPHNFVDTWLEKKFGRDFKPRQRNCNNKCSWYERGDRTYLKEKKSKAIEKATSHLNVTLQDIMYYFKNQLKKENQKLAEKSEED